jgi:tellurium resistance protein TerD
VTGIIYFNCKRGNGVVHGGDNITGEGDGDDERIRIDLENVPAATSELFIVVNIYEKQTTFDDIKEGYVRLCYAKSKYQGFEVG